MSVFLENLSCYPCTCLSISKGMVVVCQIIAARCRYSLKLMILQCATEMLLRCCQCIVKDKLGIVHPIASEHLTQTSAIKPCIVCNKRNGSRVIRSIIGKNLHIIQNLSQQPLPYKRKNLRIIGILVTQAVYLLAEPFIIIRLRSYQTIEVLHYLSISDKNSTYAANT